LPVQMKMYPPDNVVRGGRTPLSGGVGQRRPGGSDNDVRGRRTTSSALDPLVETLRDVSAEALADPKGLPPTPQERGVKITKVEIELWDRFRQLLQSELYSIPGNLAAAKKFYEVKPGENDYDACFRCWWLDAIGTRRHGLLAGGAIFFTIADDEDATETGIAKYRERLVRIVRQCFQLGKDQAVTFKVLRHAGAKAAENVAPALTLTPTGADAQPNLWAAVVAALEDRLSRIADRRESAEALKNFREAIAPVKLIGVEMDGTAPVWKLQAMNAKKTRAVLSLLRVHVSSSIRMIAGGEVQLLVMDAKHLSS
jgi:hypothetical protein